MKVQAAPLPKQHELELEEGQNSSRTMLLTVLLPAAVSALLLIAAFPRPGWFPLAWVALVPWLVSLPRLDFRQAALSSLTLGMLFFAGLLYWVALFGVVPWLLLALVEALFILAAGIVIWHGRNLPGWLKIPVTAAAWTVFEWLRSLTAYGFPWGWLGYSQSPWLSIVQLASLTGVPGITFLIVLSNAALAELFRPRRRLVGRLAPLLGTWALIGFVATVGHFCQQVVSDSGSQIPVTIVQPNNRDLIPGEYGTWQDADLHQERAALEQLTPAVARTKAKLTIWPESSLPIAINQDLTIELWTSEMARRTGGWLLLGGALGDDKGNTYNSAYLLSPAGKFLDHSEKVHLVPFGEFVPGRNWLPGIKNYPVRDFDLTPGKQLKTLAAGNHRLGVSICFESIFPVIARTQVRQGANLLVVMTNDGWFKGTAAAAQHQQMAVLRAVETRRAVARAALTGISCFITPEGRVTQQLGLNRRGLISDYVRVEKGQTPYVRYGDWFVALSALITLTGLISSCRKTTQV